MIEPAGHRVLVKVDEVKGKTSGGILLPETVRSRMEDENVYGVIVAVGKNAWKAFDDGQPWATVGDRVSFGKWSGAVIEDPDTKERFRILNDEDIAAVIRKSE